MSEEHFYSVRMLAQRVGAHHAGAERLCRREELEQLAAELVRRALEHPRGEADQVRLTLETVASAEVLHGSLPDVRTWKVADAVAGRRLAQVLLRRAGVSPVAIAAAIERLLRGAAGNGVNMRGAMLVDAASGAFVEPDAQRGVRVSRLDLASSAAARLSGLLAAAGLDRPQVREALVLAAKVLAAPGVVAELCWSDDPGYVTGYIAAPELGYCRIERLKNAGELHGGRAFFIRPGTDLPGLVDFLQRRPFLADNVGCLLSPQTWSEADGLD